MIKPCSIVCCYFCNPCITNKIILNLSEFGKVYVFINGGEPPLINYKLHKKIILIKSEKNLGTTGAYNKIINSTNHSYYWLWDQDSYISKKSAKKFLKKSNKEFLVNKNCLMTTVKDKKNSFKFLNNKLILSKASSSLINSLRVKKNLKFQFDENLFLDYGDWDFCFRIFNTKNKIIEIEGVNIGHKLGNKYLSIFGNFLSGPSPIRITLQIANTFYLFKKYKFSLINFILFLRLILLPFKLLIYNDYFKRLKYYFKGIILGLKGYTSLMILSKNKAIDLDLKS